MNIELFRKGFFKAAQERGIPENVALTIYNSEVSKHADDAYTPEDYMQVKDMLASQGYNPEYNMDDTHPYARQYNQELLKLRDRTHNSNPEVAGAMSGIGHGALGAAGGYGLGHLAGSAVKGFANPSLAQHLPGWGRAVGAAVGAIGSGVHNYNKTKTQTTAAKKLVDPLAMRRTFDALSGERQLANNQIGNYRAL